MNDDPVFLWGITRLSKIKIEQKSFVSVNNPYAISSAFEFGLPHCSKFQCRIFIRLLDRSHEKA